MLQTSRCTSAWIARVTLAISSTPGLGDRTAQLASSRPCADCPPDLDHDGGTGFADPSLLLASWGGLLSAMSALKPCAAPPRGGCCIPRRNAT